MSASTATAAPAVTPTRAMLWLEGSREIPRRLVLRETCRGLNVTAYRRKSKTPSLPRDLHSLARPLAYSDAAWDDCRLIRGDSLWMGHSAFDVTLEESARIEALFAPLGLRVEDKPS